MKQPAYPGRRLAIVRRRGELHSSDYDVTSKSTASFWHQSFSSFRPTKFVPNKQPSPGVGTTGVSDVFFVGPEKSLQFQDTIGLSSTSSWVLMALNPGYHGRESLTTEHVGFGEGGFLF